MAYTADINIVVRGARELNQLQNKLKQTAAEIQKLDNIWKGAQSGPQTLDKFNRALQTAASQLRVVRQGTEAETVAIQNYVKALNLANAARERQNRLINQEIANQRKVVPTANAGFGVQGPAPARARAATAAAGRRFDVGGVASNAIIGGAFPLLFGQGGGAATGGAIGGAIGGVFGGTGGFAGSLLGTLIGERAGRGQQVKELAADIGFTAKQTELLGQAFAKAGSDFDKFQESVSRIQGLSLSIEDQAKAIQLASALTEAYGGKIDKVTNAFTNALQTGKVTQATLNQLTSQGIPIQDALARKYDVSRSALLQMAKDGKISVQDLIDTLVQVGNAGVNSTNKAKSSFDKLKESVNNLGSAFAGLAKSIITTLQPVFNWIASRLSDLINLAATGINSITDLVTRVTQGPQQAARAALQRGELPNLQGVVEILGEKRVAELRRQAGPAFMGMGVNTTKLVQLLKQQPEFRESPQAKQVLETFNAPAQMAPSAGRSAAGRKPPEDRTAQLMEELRATIDIGKAEDRIRDLRFQGRDILAAQAEFDTKAADILRDKNNALRQANYESERIVINKIAEARTTKATLELEDQIRDITQQRFEQDMRNKEVIQQTIQPLTDFRREQELQIKYSQNFYRLVKEGILPAEAERIIQFEQLVEQQLYAVEQQIQLTEAAILEAQARGASTVELEKQLKLLKDQQDAIKGEAAKGPGPAKTDAQRLEEALGNARAELATLTDPINQITRAAEAMGAAFSNAFTGLVSGAMTGQEALASFFKGVGDHFMDMAAQMIAKLIEIYILQTVLGFIGGAAGGGGSAGPFGASKDFGGGLANSFTGKFDLTGLSAVSMPRFAEGGLVTRPTMAMVGEGGEAEYIIPASKMRGAMERYGTGARGAGVIPNGRDSGGASGGGGVTITYAGPTLNFNGDEYLPKSAVPELINAAARQGAEMGQSKTIRTLQNSRSTRSRVGI